MLTKTKPKEIKYTIAREVTYEECYREAQRIADQYEEKIFNYIFMMMAQPCLKSFSSTAINIEFLVTGSSRCG